MASFGILIANSTIYSTIANGTREATRIRTKYFTVAARVSDEPCSGLQRFPSGECRARLMHDGRALANVHRGVQASRAPSMPIVRCAKLSDQEAHEAAVAVDGGAVLTLERGERRSRQSIASATCSSGVVSSDLVLAKIQRSERGHSAWCGALS